MVFTSWTYFKIFLFFVCVFNITILTLTVAKIAKTCYCAQGSRSCEFGVRQDSGGYMADV